MTRVWWAASMRHSVASLLGCAGARGRFPDLGFEDRHAEELVARVGLRGELFSEAELRSKVLVAMVIDVVIEHQLAARPGVTVVQLGGGLSTRHLRLGHLVERWVDVDEPAAAELKRELLGEGPGYALLASEPGDTRWVDAVAGGSGGLLLVSESGLIEAAEGDFHGVLDAVVGRLPAGTELLFAHDRRHPVRRAGGEPSLAVERRAGGERLQIRYPRLRFLPRGAYDEDIWLALAGVQALHASSGGRVPAVTHVTLI